MVYNPIPIFKKAQAVLDAIGRPASHVCTGWTAHYKPGGPILLGHDALPEGVPWDTSPESVLNKAITDSVLIRLVEMARDGLTRQQQIESRHAAIIRMLDALDPNSDYGARLGDNVTRKTPVGAMIYMPNIGLHNMMPGVAKVVENRADTSLIYLSVANAAPEAHMFEHVTNAVVAEVPNAVPKRLYLGDADAWAKDAARWRALTGAPFLNVKTQGAKGCAITVSTEGSHKQGAVILTGYVDEVLLAQTE